MKKRMHQASAKLRPGYSTEAMEMVLFRSTPCIPCLHGENSASNLEKLICSGVL